MSKKRKKSIRDKQVPAGEGHCPKRILRWCGKVVLIGAAYKIYSFGVSPAQAQTPHLDAPQQEVRLESTAFQLAQYIPPVPPPTCVQGFGRHNGGEGPSPRPSPSPIAPPPPRPSPSPEEIAAQQAAARIAAQHNQAHDLNDAGVRYSNSGDYAKALECYQQAAALWPENVTIQNNLRKAEQGVLNDEGKKCWKNHDWAKAAEHFRQALSKWPDNQTVKDNLQRAEGAVQGEERQRQEVAAAQNMSAALREAAKDIGTSSSPSSGGLTFMRGTTKAGDDAATNLTATQQGLGSLAYDVEKFLSGKGFDDHTTWRTAGPSVVLTGIGKMPVLPDFVRNDKEIVQMQKDHDAFLAIQQKKDAELAQIRKQIEAEPDSAKKSDLMVKEAQIKAESAQAEYDAALKDNEIRKRTKRLIDTHVGEPPPAPSDQPPAPVAPKPGE